MKNSLIILLFFIAGLALGQTKILPPWLYSEDTGKYALYILLLLVGITTTGSSNTKNISDKLNKRILAVPLITILGTYLGIVIVAFFIKSITIKDAIAIGSGFGYYSLSSIMISEIRNEELGVIALFANIYREIVTLIFTPFFVKFFGKLAPISSGGATSMDTTLPIIS